MANHISLASVVKFDLTGKSTVFATGVSSPIGLAFDSVNYLYASDFTFGKIMKIDSSGNSSVFAAELNRPSFMAMQIPEPAALLLIGIGCLFVRKGK